MTKSDGYLESSTNLGMISNNITLLGKVKPFQGLS